MASRCWAGPEARGLRGRGFLVDPRASRLAHQARRVHQDLASPLVRPETRQALLVQGLLRHPRFQATWRHPGGYLPHRQGRRGRPQQAVRLRALHQPRHHVLHRRLREGEGGMDKLHRTLHSPAFEIRHGFRSRRL